MENIFVIYDESFQKQTEILEKELSIEKSHIKPMKTKKDFTIGLQESSITMIYGK